MESQPKPKPKPAPPSLPTPLEQTTGAESLQLSKVKRRIIAIGKYGQVACAVDASTASPADTFLDELKTGYWDDPKLKSALTSVRSRSTTGSWPCVKSWQTAKTLRIGRRITGWAPKGFGSSKSGLCVSLSTTLMVGVIGLRSLVRKPKILMAVLNGLFLWTSTFTYAWRTVFRRLGQRRHLKKYCEQ